MAQFCEHGTLVGMECDRCVEEKKIDTCWHGPSMDEYCPQCETLHPNARKTLNSCVVPTTQIDSTISSDYEELALVLERAFDQAAHGKGRIRHANDKPFTEQPIMQIARMIGLGGHSYQIMKNKQVATKMHELGEHDAAIAEFRGAIIYAAAAILLVEERSK